MKYIRIAYNGFLIFLLYTVIGQMRPGGESLENRYHRAVNSERFQKVFWTLAKPATWAYTESLRFVHEHTGSKKEGVEDSSLAR